GAAPHRRCRGTAGGLARLLQGTDRRDRGTCPAAAHPPKSRMDGLPPLQPAREGARERGCCLVPPGAGGRTTLATLSAVPVPDRSVADPGRRAPGRAILLVVRRWPVRPIPPHNQTDRTPSGRDARHGGTRIEPLP